MTLCVGTGYISENGPCTFLDMVDTHGVVLTTCADIVYAPAACPDAPDEGVVNYGPGYVKIASVGSVADLGVQRDTNGVAYGAGFVVETVSDPCDIVGQATKVDYQYVAVGPAVSGIADFQGYQSQLRLRGNGDTTTYGGNVATNVYGVAKIARVGGRDGELAYFNSCSALASAGDHHWFNQERPANTTQDLMRLSPTAGTLYFPAWTYVSDDSLKSNIVSLVPSASMALVKNLTPSTYTYTKDGKPYYGFTYSNVNSVLPTAATTLTITTSISGDGEGTTPVTSTVGGIRTNDILAVLVSAVQNLEARIVALEA